MINEVSTCIKATIVKRLFRLIRVLEASLHIKTKRGRSKDTKGILSPRVSQVNVKTMGKKFQQSSELKVTEYLVVHILSSSYVFSGVYL